MPRWGLLVEETVGTGEKKDYLPEVLEHVTGTYEMALARLEAHARAYRPRHPKMPTRTRLYRTGEGFLLVNDGSVRTYGCRFSVAELLHDSADAERAAAAARDEEYRRRVAQKEAEREAKRQERRARRGR